MCPESGKNNEHSAGFSGKRADIWALGVTLFAFTYLNVPFDGENILEIYENIENQKYFIQKHIISMLYNFRLVLPDTREISLEMADIFFRLLDKNPNTRIKMK